MGSDTIDDEPIAVAEGSEYSTVWEVGKDGKMHAYAVDENGQKTEAVWAPLPGSQEAFLESPVFETLFSGARGNGKTEALIFAFARYVEMGWGLDYKGVIFRRTYPELEDIIRKSLKVIPRIWPGAKYNKAKSTWQWPGGASLSFRHFLNVSDYDSYHGMEFAFIGWEELCSWPDDEGYKKMMSCARCSNPNVEVRVRSTTNSYGMGRNWVRDRWRLPVLDNSIVGQVISDARDDEGNIEPARVSIHGRLEENIVLMHADPSYRQRISASANGPAQRRAWLYEDWLITSGGMFDDLWDANIHMIPDIPFNRIPHGWKLKTFFRWMVARKQWRAHYDKRPHHRTDQRRLDSLGRMVWIRIKAQCRIEHASGRHWRGDPRS